MSDYDVRPSDVYRETGRWFGPVVFVLAVLLVLGGGLALLAAQRDAAVTRRDAAYGELEEAVRERDTAEAKLAMIATHCSQRLDAAIVQGPVSHLCWDIQAIIDGTEVTP